jgi:acetyl-CoA carboxylase biotin carboxyl carrier protein
MAEKIAVDDELIRRLARLLEETGLSEIEISEGSQHVRVARGHANAAPAPAAAAAAPIVDATRVAAAGESDAGHPGAVTAPIVGTLYVAPEPGAAPFVEVGGAVEEGDTMFIIEAMKTMNPVRAPRSGTVARILVANETPVEYGEVLALVE